MELDGFAKIKYSIFINRRKNRVNMLTREKRFHFDNIYLQNPKQYGAIRVYQIGDLYCGGDYEVASHRQYCHEISFIVSGIGTFYRDEKPYRVKSGEIFLSPFQTTHRIESSSFNPVRYYYLGFMLDGAHPDYPKYMPFDNALQAVNSPITVDRYNIHNLFSNLFNEIIMDCDNKDELIKSYLELLLLLTERNYRQKSRPMQKIEQDDRSKNRLVYDIINYIDNSIFNIRSLTDISKHLGYSYSYVSRVFTDAMKLPLGSYYQKVRFEKAVELIKSGINMTQVSEMLGFDSIHSFSRSFKKFYGVPPTHYAEELHHTRGDAPPV